MEEAAPAVKLPASGFTNSHSIMPPDDPLALQQGALLARSWPRVGLPALLPGIQGASLPRGLLLGPLSHPPSAPIATVASALACRPLLADDRFELLTLLGRGGVGEVWRARDLDLGRIVATKLLRPEVAQRLAGRFMNEARATAALEHPGIVPVHEVGPARAEASPCCSASAPRSTSTCASMRWSSTGSTPRTRTPARSAGTGHPHRRTRKSLRSSSASPTVPRPG